MTDKYLEEIKAREQAATPGPWKLLTRGNTVKSLAIEGVCGGMKFIDQSDAEFIAHARTDIPALIVQHEQDKTQIATLKKQGKMWKAIAIAQKDENATLKKALELMAKHIVVFGNLDTMLCDNIPQSLHFKYQPKNDGNYENEPCEKCIQDYFIQQVQEQERNQNEKGCPISPN